jgi:hypothetical protein
MDKRAMRSADKLGAKWFRLEKRFDAQFAALRKKILAEVRANGSRPKKNPRMRILLGKLYALAVIAATKTKVNPKQAEIFMRLKLPRRLMRRVLRRESVLVPVAGAEKALVRAGAPAMVIRWFRRAVKVSRATPRVRVTAIKQSKKARRK